MKNELEILKRSMDNLRVGIVLVDNDDKIILFNKIAGEMLQQNPSERVESSIYRCHGQVSEAAVRKMISDLRSHVMEYYSGWVNFRGRMLYEYIYPLWDSNGKCLCIVEELHDSAEKAEYLKIIGEWKELHISGLQEKSPRSPHEIIP